MLAFIFVIGLCVGSFMNVVILRTVSEESIVFPGSKCPKCQTPLKWYHNIPVFSYLFLRGKCGFCKEKISIQYPIVELITGILFVALFLRFCTPFDPIFGLAMINSISPLQITVYVFSLIVTCLFIAIAGTDILEKKVSDAHTLPLIGLGILYSVVFSIISFVGAKKIESFFI
jgi:leader peptidase (prepilin peptidase)/N-methyltransferase